MYVNVFNLCIKGLPVVLKDQGPAQALPQVAQQDHALHLLYRLDQDQNKFTFDIVPSDSCYCNKALYKNIPYLVLPM